VNVSDFQKALTDFTNQGFSKSELVSSTAWKSPVTTARGETLRQFKATDRPGDFAAMVKYEYEAYSNEFDGVDKKKAAAYLMKTYGARLQNVIDMKQKITDIENDLGPELKKARDMFEGFKKKIGKAGVTNDTLREEVKNANYLRRRFPTKRARRITRSTSCTSRSAVCRRALIFWRLARALVIRQDLPAPIITPLSSFTASVSRLM
jgi:hypothetical protein